MDEAAIDALSDRLTRELGAGWIEVIEWLRSTNSLADIASRMRAGDIDGVITGITAGARRFASAVNAARDTAGQVAADWLDEQIEGDLVSYDGQNDRAQRMAANARYNLIRSVTTEQRAVVRQVVQRGIAEGQNPLETAQEIRTGIGLTPAQEQIIANYRRELRAQEYDAALARRLSSGQSDRTVRAARDADRGMTNDQIDRAVERYRENWITYRAETIARTESLRAVHQGADEMIEQAVDAGTLTRDEITRTWVTGPRTGRDSPRPWHASMDGQERGIGELFVDGRGNRLRFPGDPNAPAETTINCRCVVSTRYNPGARRTPTPDDPRGQIPATAAQVDENAPAQWVPARSLAQRGYNQPAGMDAARDATVRLDNARRIVASPLGQQEPINIMVGPQGTLEVSGGRHRLQAAIDADIDVLTRFSVGNEYVDNPSPGSVERRPRRPEPAPPIVEIMVPVEAPTPATVPIAATIAPPIVEVTADETALSAVPTAPPKNPRRVEAAKIAAARSVEVRREIWSTARSNLPPHLQVIWDREGYKYIQQQRARIKGIKDPVNAGSKLSEAFIETYGSGESTATGNEGDRHSRASEIAAEHAEEWANDQESEYYARMKREMEDAGEITDGDVTDTTASSDPWDAPPEPTPVEEAPSDDVPF